MRSRPLLVLLALALGACAQAPAAPEDAAQGDTAAEAVPVESTALERALRRVDGPFPDYLEFVDRSDALGREAPVSGLAHHGRRAPEVLGVDPEAADAVIAVGRKPRFATLLIGGQDGDAVRARAEASGWADRDGALRRDLDLLNEPLTVEAATVRPLGADVALGGPDAPVELVDGPGDDLADDPDVRAMTACLGDVSAAMVAGGSLGPLRAVGVRPAPDDDADDDAVATAVLCATGTTAAAVEEAVATGESRTGRRPWAQLLRDPVVEELGGGVVRLTARTAPGTPRLLLLAALQQQDLPGVPA
jgi:hypothetical protein